jgi:hypothetical protein
MDSYGPVVVCPADTKEPPLRTDLHASRSARSLSRLRWRFLRNSIARMRPSEWSFLFGASSRIRLKLRRGTTSTSRSAQPNSRALSRRKQGFESPRERQQNQAFSLIFRGREFSKPKMNLKRCAIGHCHLKTDWSDCLSRTLDRDRAA